MKVLTSLEFAYVNYNKEMLRCKTIDFKLYYPDLSTAQQIVVNDSSRQRVGIFRKVRLVLIFQPCEVEFWQQMFARLVPVGGFRNMLLYCDIMAGKVICGITGICIVSLETILSVISCARKSTIFHHVHQNQCLDLCCCTGNSSGPSSRTQE